MSDGNELPTVNEQTPASCSSKSCCAGSMIVRAMIYTPVILGISGLAALAMFPSLADQVLPASVGSSSTSCSSGGNPNCPIQMLMRAFSSQPEMKPQSSGPSATPEQLAKMMKINSRSMSCCPSSRGCLHESAESCVSEEVANESQSASDEPTDALAAVLNSQQQLEPQEQLPASN